MTHDPEQLAATRRQVEASLGGRFRDGAECPQYVLELFELARAETAGQPLGDKAEFLHVHFEVCPVCRRMYQSALAATRAPDEDDLEADTEGREASAVSAHPPVGQSLLEDRPAIALADRQVGAPPSRRWNIEVRRADATHDVGVSDAAEEVTAVRLLWTSEAKLQIGMAGFLLPANGERLEIQWLSNAGELLDRFEISGGTERTAYFPCPPRAPVDGDHVRFRKRGRADKLLLDIAIVVP